MSLSNDLKSEDIKALLKEDEKLQELMIIKNPKPSTARAYYYVLKEYCLSTGLTPSELYDEADEDEEKGVKLKKRKIKGHLLRFIHYLRENGYKETSISTYLTYVKMFYNTFDVTVPKLPVKLNSVPKKDYKEWVTKEDIKKALNFANKKYKAIILLMSSSGLGSAEIRNLKFGDFIKSLEEYLKFSLREPYRVNDIRKAIPQNQHIVPIWYVKRIKTDEYFYTFSSPESVDAILDYLENREGKGDPILGLDECLFPGQRPGSMLSQGGFMMAFEKINDTAGFERIGSKRYFTSHELRRFFSDQAFKSGISETGVKWLRGQKPKDTMNRYIKPDPQALKIEYIEKALPCLSIEPVKIREIDEDAYERLKKLEKENLALKNERITSLKEIEYIKEKLLEIEHKQNVTSELLDDKGVREELNRREH